MCDSAYLVGSPLLCNIHMTGATATHDAIVWGAKSAQEKNRRDNTPVTPGTVEVTSELGCVTPYMVCPGEWSEEDVAHHAKHLAVAAASNNGYYCNSPKVVLLAEGWAQKADFVAALKANLKALPALAPYYPGSEARYAAFHEVYGDRVEPIQGPGFVPGSHLAFGVLELEVDPAAPPAGEYAFLTEPFCPLLTIVTLKGVATPAQFLTEAPRLANEHIWGRLSCTLVVHPDTEATMQAELVQAVGALEYGVVVLNCWSAMAYGFECGVWGAYAGGEPPLERLACVESGIGFVNNALAFDHIEKAVYRCPFVDPATQVGTGGMLNKDQVTDITNFMINPGLMSLGRMLLPTLFCSPGYRARPTPLSDPLSGRDATKTDSRMCGCW